ncbi:MAG: DUF58 domain-containing protein [Gemmataceae bacterium]|nr:DUF58 domain-containing protein [Gemmataceae bacterium]
MDDLRQALQAGEHAGANYVLRTPRGRPQGVVGGYQGAGAGSSLEFKEHRAYEPGDDLRHLDWNAYGRSDHLVVKLFHEEVTPHLDLILDGSRSMALSGSVKAHAAVALLGFFAAAAANAGFSRRTWLARDGCAPLLGSGGRSQTWELPAFDFRGSLGDAFARRPPRLRPRSFRIVISDLFWPGDPGHLLARCADQAAGLVVIQLLAAHDVRLPERGNLRLIDMETDRTWELLVDDAALERYRRARERHYELWQSACRQAGALLTTIIAEELLRDWRLDALVAAELLQVT